MTLIGLLLVASIPSPAVELPMTPPIDCTIRLAPEQDIRQHLQAGGVICLQAGVYAGGLFIENTVTLVGEPGAVIDAGGAGAAVHVAGDDVRVELRGLALRRGRAEAGGGLLVDGRAEVVVRDCAVEQNKASTGSGLAVHRGSVALERCRFGAGQDLLVTGTGQVTLDHCTVDGDVRVREGARLTVEGGRIGGVLDARGTTTRRPEVVLQAAQVGRLRNDEALPATVLVQ